MIFPTRSVSRRFTDEKNVIDCFRGKIRLHDFSLLFVLLALFGSFVVAVISPSSSDSWSVSSWPWFQHNFFDVITRYHIETVCVPSDYYDSNRYAYKYQLTTEPLTITYYVLIVHVYIKRRFFFFFISNGIVCIVVYSKCFSIKRKLSNVL